jgi:hypothetical protein
MQHCATPPAPEAIAAARRSLPVVSEDVSQSVCRVCGLCCDGTLFSRVPLDPAEIDAMRDLGFGTVHTSHPAYFTQPCSKFVGGSCSVYAKRPQNCRDFRCRLLRRLESGELSVEAALVLVKRAISLAATPAQVRLLAAEFKPQKLPGDEI